MFKSFTQEVKEAVVESVHTSVDTKAIENEIGKIVSEYLGSKKLNFKKKEYFKHWIKLKVCYSWNKAYYDEGFDQEYYGANVREYRQVIKGLEASYGY